MKMSVNLCMLLVLIGVAFSNSCEVPSWPSYLGQNPVAAARGKVLLVALVKGYCGYCVHQAENLELLKNHLTRHGFPDVEMVLVNGGERRSRNKLDNFHNAVNLTVLQDTENHIMYRQVFNGSKDDFVVYDRCGQRSFFIPHPYSYVGHQIVERILRATHQGRQSCHCALDNVANNIDPHDQMMGDQPNIPSYNTINMGDALPRPSYDIVDHSTQSSLECRDGELWCQAYSRNLANNPHHGSIHELGQHDDIPSMAQPLFHVPMPRGRRDRLRIEGRTRPSRRDYPRGHGGYGHGSHHGGHGRLRNNRRSRGRRGGFQGVHGFRRHFGQHDHHGQRGYGHGGYGHYNGHHNTRTRDVGRMSLGNNHGPTRFTP